ncbi:hypothetical protein D9M72_540610 [compost metagenome]
MRPPYRKIDSPELAACSQYRSIKSGPLILSCAGKPSFLSIHATGEPSGVAISASCITREKVWLVLALTTEWTLQIHT